MGRMNVIRERERASSHLGSCKVLRCVYSERAVTVRRLSC